MNNEQALEFLRRHRSIPGDASDQLLSKWIEVVDFLQHHPVTECIPLLIRSFGNGDHLDVYTSMQTVLRKFSFEDIRPHLKTGMKDPNPGVRQWCADTAQYFPHQDFLPELQEMLREPDPLNRFASAVTLEKIKGAEVRTIAAKALPGESDDEVRSVLRDLVGP